MYLYFFGVREFGIFKHRFLKEIVPPRTEILLSAFKLFQKSLFLRRFLLSMLKMKQTISKVVQVILEQSLDTVYLRVAIPLKEICPEFQQLSAPAERTTLLPYMPERVETSHKCFCAHLHSTQI